MRSSPLRALCPPPRTTSSSSLFGRRVGHLLELVPQKSPLALKAGEALPAPVLYDGKPLEGAGIAQVTLRPRGINTLAVDVERPDDGSLGDAAKALPVDKVLMVATVRRGPGAWRPSRERAGGFAIGTMPGAEPDAFSRHQPCGNPC